MKRGHRAGQFLLALALASPFCFGGAYGSDLKVVAETPPPSPLSVVMFAGADFASRVYFPYAGAVIAANGDFSRPGVLLRGLIGYGEFSYDSTAVPGGIVDGSIWLLDAMIGYQTFSTNVRYAGYIGVEHQDIRLRPPDPTARVQGSETGFKVLGELESRGGSTVYFNAMGSYSTAFDSYWSRFRAGPRLGRVVVGPEALFFGNASNDVKRAGAFATFTFDLRPNLTVSTTAYAGYSWVRGGDSGGHGGSRDSPYGGFTLAVVF